jgi:hypothetical protein
MFASPISEQQQQEAGDDAMPTIIAENLLRYISGASSGLKSMETAGGSFVGRNDYGHRRHICSCVCCFFFLFYYFTVGNISSVDCFFFYSRIF